MITGLVMVMVVDGIYVRTAWKQRVRVTKQMRAKIDRLSPSSGEKRKRRREKNNQCFAFHQRH